MTELKVDSSADVVCPHCGVKEVIKQGRDEVEPERQRYQCKGCGKRFDDLTGTVFEGPSS